jgi:hypothetical protein
MDRAKWTPTSHQHTSRDKKSSWICRKDKFLIQMQEKNDDDESFYSSNKSLEPSKNKCVHLINENDSEDSCDTKFSCDSVYCSPISPLDVEDVDVELLALSGLHSDFKMQGLPFSDLLFSDIKTGTTNQQNTRKRINLEATQEVSCSIASLVSPFKVAKKAKFEETAPRVLVARASATVIPATQPPKRPVFRKSMSVDEAALMFNEKNMTADFCYELCLPILSTAKHSDLKSITSKTLCRLLMGDFDRTVASFKIIDCRYPYEYEGGHIRGAINLYTEEQIRDVFMKNGIVPHVSADGKRNILVFHCEFSSERGPKL